MNTENQIFDPIKEDSQWKNHVYKTYRRLLKKDKIEAFVFLGTMFESMIPISGGFENIKDTPSRIYGITRYEVVKIPTTDNLQLDGWFFPHENPQGTLIILHGGTFNVADSLQRSLYLLKYPYQLLFYNARFWNYSRNPTEYTGFIGKDLVDLGNVIDYVSSRQDVNKNKIGLLGYSYGGLKCLLFSPGRKDIRLMISDGAPLRALWSYDQTEVSFPWLEMVKVRIHEKFGFDIYNDKYDVLKQVQKISPIPLLLLNEKNDPLLPLSVIESFYKLALPPKEMHVFQHSGHCDAMFTQDKEEYEQIVTNYLSRYLH